MKFATILVVFLLLNAFLIISNNGLALKDKENVKELGELYFDWVKNIGKNFFSLTGDVTKIKWTPEEI